MTGGGELNQQWGRVQARLKEQLGETAFRNWIQPMTLTGLVEEEVRFTAPTRFMRDWVQTHYADLIRTLWAGKTARLSLSTYRWRTGRPRRRWGPARRRAPPTKRRFASKD